MTTYIKDLIDLPERVHGGDFVLKLTEGIRNPEDTLKPYVVTEQLRTSFDDALDFIRSAVQSNSSKATYLHGSFGSGKSHFMAVLHLILESHPAARSKQGLEGVVAKQASWIEGKKFLLVPYHMIGQPSMEAAVLGGYVRKVLELHPTAPIPGVYLAEGLFRDTESHRARLGDETFFEGLNRSSAAAGGDGWGDLEAGWDLDSYEAAKAASPGSDERSRLIGALVQEYFQSYKDVARGSQEAYVSLDDGLAIISRHAASLGYEALVLFLDELILWLATHAADQHFLSTEGPKISKLVEAEAANRPIPIVSFVARQRDIRELVGDSVTGAEELGFHEALVWWQARFDTITLEDRNLPEIASRRILEPKSEAARQEIDQAWEATTKIREEVLDILLTPNADRLVFRKVYPFSPALVETLVAVSSVLQRERTALKVMLQLLVNQRATLELGEIIPVGDLFDVIAQGDEPFTEGMRLHFENAKRLYYQKLLPMLEKEHGITAENARALPYHEVKATAFRADDRLIKTMLLAALVPEVDVLKNLNSARLSALNHGSVRAPIPGRERQEVLRRLRSWASQVGEIKLGDEVDPIVSLHLSGVDTTLIIENAKGFDNTGNRRRKIKEILFKALDIEKRDEFFQQHDVAWRGVRHRFQIIFGNVRELTADSLAAREDSRKAILDFPFDEQGYTPRDDLQHLDGFRQSGKRSRTLVWIPSFLSSRSLSDLGVLVILDEVLRSDESFRRHASHLSAVDQSQARGILDGQRRQLELRVLRYLEGAYGVDTPVKDSIDESHSPAEHFQSLDPGFTPRPPVGANLRASFEALLHQVLESQYPAHPNFEIEVKLSALKKVQDEIKRATQDPGGRILIDKTMRSLMNAIAVPLGLGEMGETHFVLGRHWYNHLSRAVVDGTPVTVGELREAIDRPRPMGLTTAAEDLIIMLFADQSDCSFTLHGGTYPAKLDDLRDELVLRKQPLPSKEVWDVAIDRAAKIFGLAVSPLLNASNVSELSGGLEAQVGQLEVCQKVADRLAGLCADYAVPGSKRLETANHVLSLLRKLTTAKELQRIEILAKAEIATSAEAMGTSFTKSGAVAQAIENAKWAMFESMKQLEDDRKPAASTVLTGLVEALAHDELALALGPRIQKLENDAVRLLAQGVAQAVAPPVAQTPPPAPPADPNVQIVAREDRAGLSAADAAKEIARLTALLAQSDDLKVDLKYSIWKKGNS